MTRGKTVHYWRYMFCIFNKSSKLIDCLVREYVGMTTTFLLNSLKYFDKFWYSYRFVIICVQISIDFETWFSHDCKEWKCFTLHIIIAEYGKFKTNINDSKDTVCIAWLKPMFIYFLKLIYLLEILTFHSWFKALKCF